jgi:hypothetical protein
MKQWLVLIPSLSLVASLLMPTACSNSPQTTITTFSTTSTVSATTAITPRTNVGGVISANTTWTKENSPYLVTSTVQIPIEVTLTIEPGVSVIAQQGPRFSMFHVHGLVYAHGTVSNPITIDGGYRASIFSILGSNRYASVDLSFCQIQNGINFWIGGAGSYASLNLKYSELHNLEDSNIWYPAQDVHIEGNSFTNVGGISIATDGNTKVFIEKNIFNGRNKAPYWANYVIQYYRRVGQSEIIVSNNSFINQSGIVLSVSDMFEGDVVAANNYWRTQDVAIIDTMIEDKKDNINLKSNIQYLPILTTPVFVVY